MFPCSGCGLCCQKISNIPELKDYDLGNGICKYFDNISLNCKIYDRSQSTVKAVLYPELKYYKEFTKKKFDIQG